MPHPNGILFTGDWHFLISKPLGGPPTWDLDTAIKRWTKATNHVRSGLNATLFSSKL